MGVAGRKSYFEELAIVKRYADLTEPTFKVLKKMLNSEDKQDQKWAVEQLGKAYIKMIPQDMTSGGQPLTIQMVNYADNNDTPQLSTTEEVSS